MQIGFMLLLALYSSLVMAATVEFPVRPDPYLTPGSLCDRPDSYRYPEQIPYCKRDVSSAAKNQIFADYRNNGYKLNIVNRRDYKIDHYIPLCAGGSNHDDNLWPQHSSVFEITDPLEFMGCEKLRAGLISQRELIKLFKLVKNDLSKAPFVRKQLEIP
jgi:hypothetical protein